MSFYEVLSGAATAGWKLKLAAAFALVWFAMDAIEWVDWAYQKYSPSPTACTFAIVKPDELKKTDELMSKWK